MHGGDTYDAYLQQRKAFACEKRDAHAVVCTSKLPTGSLSPTLKTGQHGLLAMTSSSTVATPGPAHAAPGATISWNLDHAEGLAATGEEVYVYPKGTCPTPTDKFPSRASTRLAE